MVLSAIALSIVIKLIIVFKPTIVNYYFVFLNRQIPFKNVANCVNYKDQSKAIKTGGSQKIF